MTQELSPVAQAVWDAYQNAPMYFNDYEQWDRDAIALVLTAVADKLSYGHAVGSGMIDEDDIRALASEFLGESDQSQG